MAYACAEKRKSYAKDYYASNRERCLARVKACRDRLRAEILERYGSECLRCGYQGDSRALHIDHVVNGGGREREALGPYPANLKVKESVTSGFYQILCANCNAIKLEEYR